MSESAISSVSPRAGVEHPLRNANYRRWLIGSAVSVFGDQFYLIALPWLVLQQLGSAGVLGTVLMAGALPRAVLMLVGGAFSDRVSARRIMITAAVARAVCVATIGGLTALGMLSAWEVYALAIAFGIADAFAIPAQTAYMPALLRPEQLAAGLSLGQGAQLVAYTLGAVPAGLAVARFGPGLALIVDAVGFLVIIGALWGLPDAPVIPSERNTLAAIGEGVAQVLRDVPLRTLVLLMGVWSLCGQGPMTVGIAYLASSRLGSSAAYGALLSAGAVGAFVGGLASSAWTFRHRGAWILAGLGLQGLGYVSIAFVPGLWGLAIVFFLMGLIGNPAILQIYAWVLQRIDAGFRGRVSSVLQLAMLGVAPVSMAASGFMVAWSMTALFVLAGTLLLVAVTGAALLRPVREID
jgi:MFS family permease